MKNTYIMFNVNLLPEINYLHEDNNMFDLMFQLIADTDL